ncbi:MAG: pilus assembly protein N-terminal domain-containing protein [Selenomonadaceae bacterium]|nr:pilus assembly protein N-terminal domain-containing protein [Selenomonadaceae bacterium]
MKTIFKSIALIFMLLIFSTTVEARDVVKVDVNATTYVNVGSVITRITSGNPSIAVVKQVDPTLKTGFLVEGHGAGTTVVLVWTNPGQIKEYMIVVSPEDVGQALLIQEAIGLPDVHVQKIGSKILLTGSVKNQYEHNYALQVASFYVGGSSDVSINTGSNVKLDLDTSESTSNSSDDIEPSKVESSGSIIDLLKMTNPTQIKLEAQVIDINSNNTSDLGFQYGQGSGISISPGYLTAGEDIGRGGYSNNPLKWFDRHRASLGMSIQALVEQGKARILSRPSITTLSGEQATIQIGGRIPYRAINSYGFGSTQFENYGIILQCKPIVDADNKITVAVHAEVSNLSGQAVDGQPIISTRHADSVVNLESGTSMLIGGLMDSSEGKSVQKIPLLGDIPIIGEFFKYTNKSRDKRELVIIITPTVIETTDSGAMTEEMHNAFEQSKQELQNREDVNLNFDKITLEPFDDKR